MTSIIGETDPRFHRHEIVHGTSAQWAASTTQHPAGIIGFDTDLNELRVFPGGTLWRDLPPGLPATRASLMTLLSGVYVPRWQPLYGYHAGDPVLAPTGAFVTSNADQTSGATYDSTLWTPVPVNSYDGGMVA